MCRPLPATPSCRGSQASRAATAQALSACSPLANRRPPFKRGDPIARELASKGGRVTAALRRASKQAWRGTILDLMDAAGMRDAEWTAWRAFWKAVYALSMTADELDVYQRHTQRHRAPNEPVAEAWMCIGRGGGKTRNSALHAVYRAITFDMDSVDPGEDVVIPLLASDRRQAQQGLKYIRGFNALPMVSPYVFRGTLKETVEYQTGVNVEVTTASKKAPRGYTCPTTCCDEIAWWRSEDDGTNPDHEVITAVRGSLGRVAGSLLLALSNPYAPKGELHNAVEHSFGRDDPEILVWNADTLSMNPTYDRKAIARAFKRDSVVAASEFGSNGAVAFRQARQALFDQDAVCLCVMTGRRELPPVPGTRYVAFVDASQGQRGGDPMALGIAHRDEGRAVLDLVRAVDPPFNPADVVRAFAAVMHGYGVAEVQGDRVSLGFVLNEFASVGIKFVPSPLTKSALFGELLPLVNTGRVELLDNPTLKTQLLVLERRAVRGGRDSVDHPRGAHDDVANAAAGALVQVTGVGQKQRLRVRFSGSGENQGTLQQPSRRERERAQNAEALRMVDATRRVLEAQERRTRKVVQRYEDEPMRSEPVWHVH